MKKFNYIIDLDGTIYKNKIVFDEAILFIDYLNETKRKYVFLTNCPEKVPTELHTILNTIGIKSNVNQIVTSGIIAMHYLTSIAKEKSVYVIGSPSFKELLRSNTIEIIENTEKIADYVLVGFDKKFNYDMLSQACHHVLKGAKLIATNDDESIPTLQGNIPHTGAILKAIEYTTHSTAEILGKPSKFCCKVLCNILDATTDNLCMIGDRLDTDMMFAKNNNFTGYLMTTGITTMNDINNCDTKSFEKVFNNLSELMDFDKSQSGYS